MLDALRGQVADERVLVDGGEVEHAADPRRGLRERPLHVREAADVHLARVDVAAHLGERAHEAARAVRDDAPAAGEHEVARPEPGEPERQPPADAAERAGDEVRPVRVHERGRRGLGVHVARRDVDDGEPGGRPRDHGLERRGELGDGADGVRDRGDLLPVEHPDELGDDLVLAPRVAREEHVRLEAHVRLVAQQLAEPDARVVRGVELRDVDEPAVGAEAVERRQQPAAGERREHHVDAPAVGGGEDVAHKRRGAARVGHDVALEHVPEHPPLLLGPGGGDDGGAHALREADRRLPHAARGAVDQHGLALAQPAVLVEAPVRGLEVPADAERLLRVQRLGRGDRAELRHDDVRREERPRGVRGEDLRAHRQRRPRARRDDGAHDLLPQLDARHQLGDEPEARGGVLELQAHLVDGDHHLVVGQARPHRRGVEGALDDAVAAALHRVPVARERGEVRRLHAQHRRLRLAPAQHDVELGPLRRVAEERGGGCHRLVVDLRRGQRDVAARHGHAPDRLVADAAHEPGVRRRLDVAAVARAARGEQDERHVLRLDGGDLLHEVQQARARRGERAARVDHRELPRARGQRLHGLRQLGERDRLRALGGEEREELRREALGGGDVAEEQDGARRVLRLARAHHGEAGAGFDLRDALRGRLGHEADADDVSALRGVVQRLR